MNLLFLDCETTGREDSRLIQLAYRDGTGQVTFNGHFKPPVPIEIGAMATHHITNEDVATRPSFSDSQKCRDELSAMLLTHVPVMHNAQFDVGVLQREGIVISKYICTLKVAQYILPPQEQYKLPYLFYALDCHKNMSARAIRWHDAEGDIFALEHVFQKLFRKWCEYSTEWKPEEQFLEDLVEFSVKPMLLKFVPFGKHKGKEFAWVALHDRDYLNWAFYKMENKGIDLEYTLRYYLHL